MPIYTAKVILQEVPKSYKMSDGTQLKPLNDLNDLNKWLIDTGIHNKKGFNEYDKSVYIQGDFTKSVEHAKNDVKKNNGKFDWNDEIYVALGGSCATESVEILYSGNFTKYQGITGNIMEIFDYPLLAQVIPMSLHYHFAEIFGNSDY